MNALPDPRSLGGRELLTWDEARRIAANIAKLPELLRSRGAPETTSGLLWPGAGHPKGGSPTARVPQRHFPAGPGGEPPQLRR